MHINKLNELRLYFIKSITDYYPEKEIESLSNIVFQHILKLSRLEMHIKRDMLLTDKQIHTILDIIDDLKNHKPIQYILGELEFYNIILNVNQHVLIPRPETEELVQWIINEEPEPFLKIIDIGTGSGCIAISLGKNLKNSNVFAIDISKNALELAKRNAMLNNVNISFNNHDIFNLPVQHSLNNFDIMVSNPPYVLESEKELMDKNVLEYEPHEALFVPDSNPLSFYEAIAKFAQKQLKINGRLYVEINEKYGEDCFELFSSYGFTNIIVKKDIHDKQRFVSAIKSE